MGSTEQWGRLTGRPTEFGSTNVESIELKSTKEVSMEKAVDKVWDDCAVVDGIMFDPS